MLAPRAGVAELELARLGAGPVGVYFRGVVAVVLVGELAVRGGGRFGAGAAAVGLRDAVVVAGLGVGVLGAGESGADGWVGANARFVCLQVAITVASLTARVFFAG